MIYPTAKLDETTITTRTTPTRTTTRTTDSYAIISQQWLARVNTCHVLLSVMLSVAGYWL